ncbi:hypothetical protein WDH52_05655 [Streptomyces sp. TRM70308]|uniref:hypothetical protein n=1 Tax=Streptomyces sp. TRM70308 TaxID=3131932 RepID=UPI003D005B74
MRATRTRSAGVVSLLVGAAVLLPVPAVASGHTTPGHPDTGRPSASHSQASPTPSGDPETPPEWLPTEAPRFPPHPGAGPDGPPEWTKPSAPSSPTPSPSTEPASPTPSGSPTPSEPPAPSPTPTEQRQDAAPPPVEQRQAPERTDHGHGWVPLPDGPQETFGSYDLYADYAEESEPRPEPVAAGTTSGPVLPVLSLGAGLASLGLGLAFIALRLRRG